MIWNKKSTLAVRSWSLVMFQKWMFPGTSNQLFASTHQHLIFNKLRLTSSIFQLPYPIYFLLPQLLAFWPEYLKVWLPASLFFVLLHVWSSYRPSHQYRQLAIIHFCNSMALLRYVINNFFLPPFFTTGKADKTIKDCSFKMRHRFFSQYISLQFSYKQFVYHFRFLSIITGRIKKQNATLAIFT